MSRLFAACAFALFALFSASVALAQTGDARVLLGYGRLVTNDALVDGQDRWRSGSVSSSRIRGFAWQGHLPEAFGDIIEYRLMAETIAPANLARPAAGDRPYSGAWSLGAHSYFQRRGFEFAVGGDLVMTGPQSGIGQLQSIFHDLIGVPVQSATVKAGQIPNGVHPTLVVESGRTFDIGGQASVRPFLEGRLGSETIVRAGFDISIGRIGRGELLVRDPVTGQRYRTIQQPDTGVSFVLGADIAKVADSIYLPSARYSLTPSRQRVRAGLHWQGDRASTFYGVTWLGEEFSGQSEGQILGSLRLNLDF
ncbi:MAG: DUF2219 family protein [Rhodobacterales bacterium]|nr:DUF2219 family protein [Rhodobacterales bacterium]